MAKRKLLIHHHMVACQSDDGLYIQSFIGAWVQALSIYFDEIGLLFKISTEKLPQQDYCVSASNVKLIPIQTQGLGYLAKRKKIIEICRKIGSSYNILIIRGITPLQKIVFDNVNVQKKYFLLVGSLANSKPRFRFNRIDLIIYTLYWVRLAQFQRIAQNAEILANSPVLLKELSKKYNIYATFIPTNTISDSHFVSENQNHIPKNKDSLKLIFCGRIVYEKGIEELFDAIAILNKLGYIAKLDMIGPVACSYKKFLDNRSEELDITKQINYLGYIGFGLELLHQYRNADFFILPTWHEGFPHSIWEAACSNTPVIVTPVGGIPGIVSENEVYFIELKNAVSIADTLMKAFDQREKTLQKVKQAYQLAKNFTVEKCAEKLSKFID